MLNDDDFPALPNSTGQAGQPQQQQKSIPGMSSAAAVTTNDLLVKSATMRGGGDVGGSGVGGLLGTTTMTATTESGSEKTGIQTHADGRVTNIPPGMLNDQFGMAGLLTFLRTIESSPGIVGLALGHDLTNLGLNLNSSKRNLYQTFGGPWADFPCRIQDLDAKVPEEYLTNATIRDKLPNIKLNKLHEDVLFYLFYNCPGEVYQVAAASELYARDWRYHKVERFWLQRASYSAPPREIGGTYERCQYNVFDPILWRRVPREMVLEYKDLEGKPSVPGTSSSSSAAAGNSTSSRSHQQPQQHQSSVMGAGAGTTSAAAAVASSLMTPSSHSHPQQHPHHHQLQHKNATADGGGGGDQHASIFSSS